MPTPITMTVEGANGGSNRICKPGTGVVLKGPTKVGGYTGTFECKDMCKNEPLCRQVTFSYDSNKCTLYKIPCTVGAMKQYNYIYTKEGGPTQDEQAISNEKDIALLKQQLQIEALQK